MNKALLMGIACTLLGITACTKNKVEDYKKGNPPPLPPVGLCDSLAPTYATVSPIIAENCTQFCHKSGAPGQTIILGGYNELKDAIQNRHLLEAIRHQAPYQPMPQGGNKLADSIIQKIECWKDRNFPQ